MVDNLLIKHRYFYSMHLTFTAQCGTELDHSEMLRLGQASHSYIHSVTLRELSTCTLSTQPSEVLQLAPASKTRLQTKLPLQREKITPPLTKTHHSLFIYMPGREYFIVNVWLTIMLLNNDWKHSKVTIISGVEKAFSFMKSTRLGLQRFQMKQGLTGNGGTVHFGCEMGQENLMRVNHRVWHALWTWSAAKKKAFFSTWHI